MSNKELVQLINSAKDGDKESINVLSHRYLERGFRLVRNMNLINTKSIYEDQDYGFIIYKSLINSVNKYEGQTVSPEAFIIQRMKRDIKKFFLRLISRKNLECMKTNCYVGDYDFSCNLDNPEKCYKLEEKIEILKSFIGNSDEEEKQIIEYLIQGYGCQEICEKMKRKYSYIYNKIRNLKLKVKIIDSDN